MKRFMIAGCACLMLGLAAGPTQAVAAPGGFSALPAQIEATQPPAVLQADYYYDRYHHRHWRRPPPPPPRHYDRRPPPPYRR